MGVVYQVCWLRISSCEEGKEESWLCEEEYIKPGERERGSNIIFSLREEGKAMEIQKIVVGKNIKL